jgi:elongation factor P
VSLNDDSFAHNVGVSFPLTAAEPFLFDAPLPWRRGLRSDPSPTGAAELEMKQAACAEPAGSLEKLMVLASELREGMALRIDQQVFRVVEVESKAGAAKMGGTVRARLSNVRSGRLWDQHFRPLERLEDVELEKRKVEFLFSDGANCIFQRLDSFEQVEFPAASLGLAEKFLEPGAEVSAQFFEGEPISVVLPDTAEARVVSTGPPARSQQDSSRKEATLENGLTIQVPLFVAPGEVISIDFRTGRYVERVRTQHKKGV